MGSSEWRSNQSPTSESLTSNWLSWCLCNHIIILWRAHWMFRIRPRLFNKNILLISTYGKQDSLFPLPWRASRWKCTFTKLCAIHCWHVPCVPHRQMGTHSPLKIPHLTNYIRLPLLYQFAHEKTVESCTQWVLILSDGYSWLSNEW